MGGPHLTSCTQHAATETLNLPSTVATRIIVDTTLTTLITPAPAKLKRDAWHQGELVETVEIGRNLEERQAAFFTPVAFRPLNPSQRVSVCSCLIAQPTTTSTVTTSAVTTAVTTTVATITQVTTVATVSRSSYCLRRQS